MATPRTIAIAVSSARTGGRDALQRDAQHQLCVSSSIAAITGARLGVRHVADDQPSARKRIRSAIAAAYGSCVTITVVWPRRLDRAA
jgi:hypothetical protein